MPPTKPPAASTPTKKPAASTATKKPVAGNRPVTASGHVLTPARTPAPSRANNGNDNGRGNGHDDNPRSRQPQSSRTSNHGNSGNWWDAMPGDPMSVAADLHRMADRIHPGPGPMDSRSRAGRQADDRGPAVKKAAAKPPTNTKTASKTTSKASPDANGRASQARSEASKTRSR